MGEFILVLLSYWYRCIAMLCYIWLGAALLDVSQAGGVVFMSIVAVFYVACPIVSKWATNKLKPAPVECPCSKLL
jgi:hypothetical protein